MVRKIRGLFSSSADQQEQPSVQVNEHRSSPPTTLRRSPQQVTWSRPITAPSAWFQTGMTSGVGSSSTWHRFRAKKVAASSDSSTGPPAPTR
jgi:hypothetical protein